MTNELQVFTHEGGPIYYRLVGPEGSPLVVLTHGTVADHRTWEPQLPASAEQYLGLFAYATIFGFLLLAVRPSSPAVGAPRRTRTRRHRPP